MTRTKPPAGPTLAARTPRRNVGGSRREAAERIALRAPGFETSGWTLNVSRGGMRAVVENALALDLEYELAVGDDEDAVSRKVRVIWLQDKPDGQIVGLKYLDVDGSVPPEDS